MTANSSDSEAIQTSVKRCVELNFFDFESFPKIENIPADVLSCAIAKGDLRSNKKTIQTHNSLSFRKDYHEEIGFDDALTDFFVSFFDPCIGVPLVKRVGAKETFIRLHIPVTSSEWNQEDNLDISVLKKIVDSGLSLDFWFN